MPARGPTGPNSSGSTGSGPIGSGATGSGAVGAKPGDSPKRPAAPTEPAPAPAAPSFAIIEPVCAVFRRTLRGEGLKYTPERANVLNVVMAFDGLFEADQVIARLKADGFRVSKATVYRTLKLLAEAGIIQRVLIDSEQAHYQLVYGEQRPRHILVRVDTNQVVELDIPEVEELVRRVCTQRGVTPASFRLHIFAHE